MFYAYYFTKLSFVQNEIRYVVEAFLSDELGNLLHLYFYSRGVSHSDDFHINKRKKVSFRCFKTV